MKVHNNKSGYAQYDPTVMYPIGKPAAGRTVILRMFDGSPKIHSTVGGTAVKTLGSGDVVQALDFLEAKDSTGYRWVKVSYTNDIGNILGYMKYDPALMFPYTAVGKAPEGATEDEDAEKSSGENLHMVLTGSAAAIRSSAVKGAIKEIVGLGSKLWIDEIYNETSSDGYRWMKTHNTQNGYSQMDLNVMFPVGKPVGNAQIRLTKSSARIRTKVVDGAVLTTVENGGTFIVLDFLPNKASDGYRWMKVLYSIDESRTGTGYAQFDPTVMFPYTISGKPTEQASEDTKAEESSGESLHMRLAGSAARIRKNAVSGDVLETVADGGKLWVDKIYKEPSSDGYRWMAAHANTQGYSQMDLKVMIPVGKAPADMQIRLTGSSAAIRTHVVSGEVIATVENGGTFIVDDFLPNVASDGYRWMKVTYALNTSPILHGYAQFDPNVMYPYNSSGKPTEQDPVDAAAEQASGEVLHLLQTGSPARIRQYAVKGSVLETVENGGKLWVNKLYSDKNSDGYRWAQVYSSKTGYAQFDTNVMHPVGGPMVEVTMQLAGTEAAIRDHVRGKQLTKISDGGRFRVHDFLPKTAKDGYRWMKVTGNGVTGFAQYDPRYMYPYTTAGKPAESTPVVNSVKMVLTGSAARIRNDVQGSVLVTVPNGGEIQVQDFYDWKATDNYRWCWGSYGGYNGAFQYDPAVMHPVGTTGRGLLKMRLEKSAARLRSSVQGTVLITVPNGSEIVITEFLPSKASDNYYWCVGSYNGTTGYFQYDPAVMFPCGNV